MHATTDEFMLLAASRATRVRETYFLKALTGAALSVGLWGAMWLPMAAVLGTARPEPMPPTASTPVVSVDSRTTHEGRYSIGAVDVAPPTVGASHTWTIRLEDAAARPVEGAHLTAQGWMPETGEGSPVAATARELGEGRYEVTDIVFSRPGWWNLALVIRGPAGTDSAAFNVILPSREQ
jgi:hypothetical protein